MLPIKIVRPIVTTTLIGALVLVPISALAGDPQPAAATDRSGSGNKTAVGVLHDMSTVMSRWMTEMSDPGGLSSAEAHRLAGEMQTMSGMMMDMSSMMRTASQAGSKHDGMMGGGHGMMSGNGRSVMMMNSRAMQEMHESMQKLLANNQAS